MNPIELNRRIYSNRSRDSREGGGKVNREASRMERSRVGKWRFVTGGKLVARNLEIAKWWRVGDEEEVEEAEVYP